MRGIKTVKICLVLENSRKNVNEGKYKVMFGFSKVLRIFFFKENDFLIFLLYCEKY